MYNLALLLFKRHGVNMSPNNALVSNAKNLPLSKYNEGAARFPEAYKRF
jgi:hypothetical protein